MPKQTVNPRMQQAIKTLWEFQVPPKIIAEALGIKYPLVTLYCRGFKATEPSGQYSSYQIAFALLSPSYPIIPSTEEAKDIIKQLVKPNTKLRPIK